MQLTRGRVASLALAAATGGAVLSCAAAARADVAEVDTTHALYHEAPTRTHMTREEWAEACQLRLVVRN